MGLFSWFSSTAKKSAAAVALENYYSICKRHGVFYGDPATFANRIVGTACDKLSGLAQGDARPLVLAAASLVVVMKDEGPGSNNANLYVMGLGAMLQALFADTSVKHTPSEARMVAAAFALYEEWGSRPSPWLTGMDFGPLDPGPMTTAHPPGEPRMLDTTRSREADRAELVRRMREADGKA
jgi:hypothetical protein